MAVNGWTRKSLLTIEDLNPDEISLILDTADLIKRNSDKSDPVYSSLKGKRVINLFMEPSTRTRVA